MDNKFENNDIVYYQLDGGFIKHIKNWWQKSKINKLKSYDNIFKGISEYKEKNCEKKYTNTCLISNDKIEQISKFLSHILPKCKKLNITLNDIKNGNILGAGAYGYTFKTKDKVIKIILCEDLSINKILEEEINIHTELMHSKFEKYFIKMFGYIKKDDNNIYKYYDINNQQKCSYKNTTEYGCETYVFLEAGVSDLKSKFNNCNNLTEQISTEQITTKFYELLNFYKVSSEFLKNSKVFIHADIKLDNIVCVQKSDKKDYDLKLIDFGISKLTEKFYINTSNCTTKIYAYYVKNKTFTLLDIILSPVYDVFCLVLSYVQFLLPQELDYYKTNDYIELIKNINILISNESIKLKMYKLLCIGWLFQWGMDKKTYKINDKPILCDSCSSTQKMYEYMDKIITKVCECTTIEQIKNIECNDDKFSTEIKFK